MRGGATGGLTIVGILIPLSVLAIQLRAGTSDVETRLPNAVLIDFFMGDVWLVFFTGVRPVRAVRRGDAGYI